MTSTYETTDGTTPVANAQHEPRTVTRAEGDDLFMMTEIGDGVFVQWGECRKCSKRVTTCQCAGGPVEPPFMQKWRDERFERSFTGRPSPDYTALPQVIEVLKDLGYTVTKDEADPECVTDEVAGGKHAARPEERTEGGLVESVNSGLDAVLAKVREAKGL